MGYNYVCLTSCNKLDIKKPDVLVEIGAGTAFFSIAFLQYLKPSSMYA